MKKLMLLFLLFTTSIYSQDFKKDWQDFKVPEDWTIEFVSDTTMFLGSRLEGQLVFRNEKDKELYAGFYVFKTKHLKSDFNEALKKHYMMQSCIVQIDLNKKITHHISIPYTLGKYYYISQSCGKCNIAMNYYCTGLAEALGVYIKN